MRAYPLCTILYLSSTSHGKRQDNTVHRIKVLSHYFGFVSGVSARTDIGHFRTASLQRSTEPQSGFFLLLHFPSSELTLQCKPISEMSRYHGAQVENETGIVIEIFTSSSHRRFVNSVPPHSLAGNLCLERLYSLLAIRCRS